MKISLALAALAVLSSPAIAGGPTMVADDPMPAAAPDPVAVHDWSGPYAGLSYGRISGDYEEVFGFASDYSSGSAVGAFVGYNVQRGQIVYGGELSYSSVSDVALEAGGGDDTLDSLLDLRGRIGYSVGKALIYGAVGYSRGEWTINSTGGGTLSGSSLGVGVDVAVSQRMFVGLDYTSRRMDGTLDSFSGGGAFDVESTTTNSVSLRVGLSF
ncbi:outer membrane protein [Rhodobacter sp. SY28-1]|uniref:outer membrane protein n=1 Tax=Rhodobacter sp. SY28-1 TaxID=2562317 RepID=UPI0010C06C48|nr:outer membrane beta-barrel protein [Rhodobacter sp. SY28-1]